MRTGKWIERKVLLVGLAVAALALSPGFPGENSALQAKPNACGFELVEQPGNPLYPYKITKKGNFVSFITLKDDGPRKMISIGGQYYTYNTKSGQMKWAEKNLNRKASSVEDAVKIAYNSWSKEHCSYMD